VIPVYSKMPVEKGFMQPREAKTVSGKTLGIYIRRLMIGRVESESFIQQTACRTGIDAIARRDGGS
jgi:hypothetical protein